MSFRGLFVATAAVLAIASSAHAANTFIDFEGLADGTVASNQFTGMTISGGSVLTLDVSLNPAFPPHSGSKLLYDYLDGDIVFDFSTNVDSFSAFVTGNRNIVLSIFNGATLLGSTSTGNANYGGAGTGLDPNIQLSLSSGTNITRAVFSNLSGFGNTFTIDDVDVGGRIGGGGGVITDGGVPEPSTWAMMLIGFAGLGAAIRRRRTVTAVA